ncbi:hypothetical protein GCM10010123_44650 [Pilimelia anulata]|uniref:DUF6879 domain-containing protein n=1 Tax=Pilimelia anulata TaxID=53371 RepID=A0A8J3FDE2_9ACTN|nr:DUF6879 family protein [Pilimelia anulata]GGK09791.1 hypothetical protein GCM10010123_44650 [Pilimelia anulata]
MREVPYSTLRSLVAGIDDNFVHLELRDTYGTDVEIPKLRAFLDGKPDDHVWLEQYLSDMRRHTAAGRRCRRLRIVSEPLSDYQRWGATLVPLFRRAGEDARYLPRRQTSTLLLPGNDFYVFDSRTALFLHYSGGGSIVGRELTTEPDVVRTLLDAFERAWALSDVEYLPE